MRCMLFLLLCCYACFHHVVQYAVSSELGNKKIPDIPSGLHLFAANPFEKSIISAPAPSPESMENEDDIMPLVSPGANPNPFLPSYAPSPLQPFVSNPSLPKLSGMCPLNFTAAAHIVSETAVDCWSPLALYLGNAICCPQLETMFSILIGQMSKVNGMLALNSTVAGYCFSDVQRILTSQGANASLSHVCSVHSSNLTEGSCPVKSVKEFQETVNTSGLLEACKTVDPVKECCNPVCQPAIVEAARKLTLRVSSFASADYTGLSASQSSVVSDCEKVARRWLASKLSFINAKAVLRGLFNCDVNKVCPLSLPNPSEVARTCSNNIKNGTQCCTTLEKYIAGIQQQSLITNLQALDCADSLGMMLQSKNVTENVYTLCHVNLKDFSLQAFVQQGCLLRSLPSDVTYDKVSGISFTCDLNDNIAAPWPSHYHAASPSSCNRAINMPAFPATMTSLSGHKGVSMLVFVISALGFTILYP